MRKSRSVRLVLLGSAGLALAACDEPVPKDAEFFSDAASCSRVHNAAACREAEGKAQEAFSRAVPRYGNQFSCEIDFGINGCGPEQRDAVTGERFFGPVLMGFLAGNMLGSQRQAWPVYRGFNNTAIVPQDGRHFHVGSFAAGARGAQFRPATQVASVSRGGFGGTAEERERESSWYGGGYYGGG